MAVTAAKAQTVRLAGEDVGAGLVAELAQGVINLDERIKHTDADIEERFRRHPLAEVITSLPGIGFRLGAEFLAVVGDPALLQSPDQLAAWAGIDQPAAPIPLGIEDTTAAGGGCCGSDSSGATSCCQ